MFVDGRVDANSEEKALLCDQVEPAAEAMRREVAGLVLHLSGPLTGDAVLQRLHDLVQRHRGNQQLGLDVEQGGHCHRIRADCQIRITEQLLDELADLVGPANILFTRV